MPCFNGLIEEDKLNDAIQDVIFSIWIFKAPYAHGLLAFDL